MINIIRNTTNNCVFTLFEKTTLQNANYILQLHSNDDQTDKYMWLYLSANTTGNQQRYDLYEIEETTNEDVYNLKVNLTDSQYDYTVWQTTGSTLSTSALTRNDIVERGALNVTSSGTTTPTYNNNNTEYTFI
jgi:hypothetical protein